MSELIGGPMLPFPWLMDWKSRPSPDSIKEVVWHQLDAAASWAWNRAYSAIMKALPYALAALLILVVYLLRDWIFPKPVYIVQ